MSRRHQLVNDEQLDNINDLLNTVTLAIEDLQTEIIQLQHDMVLIQEECHEIRKKAILSHVQGL